jgi:uncharacterized protein YcfJ
MSRFKTGSAMLAILAALSGCAAPPMGPTVLVMPAPGKPTEVFNQDQAYCKSIASNAVAGQAEQANNQAVGGALLGTALGAGLGAAVGGGRGAAIGAASGAAVGTGYGAAGSSNAQYGIQAQYDNAYVQCMYTRGNQVPGYGAPAPGYGAPPPPPGWAVPPPPRY